MKITHEEIEKDRYDKAVLMYRTQRDILSLLALGFDSQWRVTETDPPPKVGGTLIENYGFATHWFTLYHDELAQWVEPCDFKPNGLGTRWRYAIGPKTEDQNE